MTAGAAPEPSIPDSKAVPTRRTAKTAMIAIMRPLFPVDEDRFSSGEGEGGTNPESCAGAAGSVTWGWEVAVIPELK